MFNPAAHAPLCLTVPVFFHTVALSVFLTKTMVTEAVSAHTGRSECDRDVLETIMAITLACTSQQGSPVPLLELHLAWCAGMEAGISRHHPWPIPCCWGWRGPNDRSVNRCTNVPGLLLKRFTLCDSATCSVMSCARIEQIAPSRHGDDAAVVSRYSTRRKRCLSFSWGLATGLSERIRGFGAAGPGLRPGPGEQGLRLNLRLTHRTSECPLHHPRPGGPGCLVYSTDEAGFRMDGQRHLSISHLPKQS